MSTLKRIPFEPNVHGFNFENDFANDFVKDLDIRTGGLCGGMVYSALDYFLAKRAIPRQDYRPANRTTLQSYIYERQVTSLLPNMDKWIDLEVNPLGARDLELFQRGLTSELENLRKSIDAGKATPLGVIDEDGDTKHQILAIGYTTDTAGKLETILIYDPSIPNETVIMRPNPGERRFQYDGHSDKRWRTYFVDRSYQAKAPPAIGTPDYPNDGKIRELVVVFGTGDDELRGGNDNVDLVLHLKDGTKVRQPRINLGARWLKDYDEAASVILPAPIPKADIVAVEFVTSFTGGAFGDNWDTRYIEVTYYEKGNDRDRLVRDASFFRFTGDHRSRKLTVPKDVPRPKPGQITWLKLTIKTGSDDLRGNEDNLDITVRFADGTSKKFPSVNYRKRWADHESHKVALKFERGYDRHEIVGLTLCTTFSGGTSGDNWNMDRLEVVPMVGKKTELPAYVVRSGSPVKRFTGDSEKLTVEW